MGGMRRCIVVIAASCASPAAATHDAAVAPSPDAPPASSGVRTVAGCGALGIGSEPCSFTFVWDPERCTGRACSRLVIFFSGGQESCPEVDSQYLAHYRALGYVAVCALPFESADGSAVFPRHLEAPRFDALIGAITSDPDVRAGWSGEYLLYSGVSHGASGPVVAMATGTFDDQASWNGAAYTGACFYDGTYDAPALLAFDFTNQCTELPPSKVSYKRTYSRYCAWPGNAFPNLPATWPAPSTCSTADTASDVIGGGSVGAFAIHDWALIECGSQRTACDLDVLPAASIHALCDGIAATSGYSCAFESFPDSSHVACGIDADTQPRCSAWFEAQLTDHGFR